MKLLYAKSKWEAAQLSLPAFLERAAADGFDAVELELSARPEPPRELRRRCEAAGLKLIAQLGTAGATPDEHARSLEQQYARAVEAGALFVDAQTGRDLFDFEQSLRLFERGQQLADAGRLPLRHETHRSRALFNGPAAAAFLRALPGLQLTADLSHWCCVHESDLSDQPGNLAAAIAASHHVHARVGFDQGPQAGDPRGDVFEPWLELHLGWWRRIIAARKAEGCAFLTITPEFGPAPYMPVLPLENEPVADAWAVNVWMRDRLTLEFGREA